MAQRRIGQALMADGGESYGKQAGDTPFFDVAVNAKQQTLRTFRDHVEDHVAGRSQGLPRGYQEILELRTDDDELDVVFVGKRNSSLGVLATVDLKRLMAGSQLRWRFEMAPKVGY